MDNLNVEFHVKVNDDVYTNIDALRTICSLHLGNTRYQTIRKGLVKIKMGLLDLGMHRMRMGLDKLLLFSTLHLKDKVRPHGEGNDRNRLIHVYAARPREENAR